MKGKMKRKPMTGTINWNANEIMDVLVCDVMGPMKYPTIGGNKYILATLDVNSKCVSAYIMKKKSDVTNILMSTIKQLQTQTGKKLKRLHTDGGGEFVNGELDEFLKQNGTIHTTTTPNTPQHNAIIERMNFTLLSLARSMMYHCGATIELWGEAVSVAAYLLRQSLASSDPHKTPSERFNNKKPSISNLHVFGSDVYIHKQKEENINYHLQVEKEYL